MRKKTQIHTRAKVHSDIVALDASVGHLVFEACVHHLYNTRNCVHATHRFQAMHAPCVLHGMCEGQKYLPDNSQQLQAKSPRELAARCPHTNSFVLSRAR